MENSIITIEYSLSRENYDDIIEMSGYGVGYWASAMSSSKDGCQFVDGDSGKEFFVTPAKVQKAIAELHGKPELNEYYQSAIRTLVNEGCSGDVGADIADAIIQKACFGSVIYG
tara:strand:- start:100 stop:441 length:342 start_codon:yes stop_codon:yes gene_type:complete